MDPPGGNPPGEEPPQLVMRPVFCLVRSRAAGQQQYTTLESKATKRMANMAWTGHEAFSKLAPDLVKSGLDRLELEEVGFVERGSVTNMRQQGFQDALFVTDELLDEPLGLTFDNTMGGLVFHTLRRPPPHLLSLPPPMQQQPHQHQQQQHQLEEQQQQQPPPPPPNNGFAAIMASQRPVHRPARKETTARTKNMVRVGIPSSELAFNHAIECLERFDIGFTSTR